MTDFQICIAAISKMPWLLIIPIGILAVGLHEAIEKEWDRRGQSEKKTVGKITKRDKLKGKYHQKYFVGRN